MALGGWSADYPAASNFITAFFMCDALDPASGFCDPGIDAMVEEAIGYRPTTPSRPAHSGRRSIARSSTRPRYVWLENAIARRFVSERVGNYQFTLNGACCSISSGSVAAGTPQVGRQAAAWAMAVPAAAPLSSLHNICITSRRHSEVLTGTHR